MFRVVAPDSLIYKLLTIFNKLPLLNFTGSSLKETIPIFPVLVVCVLLKIISQFIQSNLFLSFSSVLQHSHWYLLLFFDDRWHITVFKSFLECWIEIFNSCYQLRLKFCEYFHYSVILHIASNVIAIYSIFFTEPQVSF